MTTALFLLRAVQMGIAVSDLELLTVGMVNEMFSESINDNYNYKEIADQDDFNIF